VYNLTKSNPNQTTLDSLLGTDKDDSELTDRLESIRKRYDMDSLDRYDIDRDTIRTIAEHMRTHRAR